MSRAAYDHFGNRVWPEDVLNGDELDEFYDDFLRNEQP